MYVVHLEFIWVKLTTEKAERESKQKDLIDSEMQAL